MQEPRKILSALNPRNTKNESFKDVKDTNVDALAEGKIGNLEREEKLSTPEFSRARYKKSRFTSNFNNKVETSDSQRKNDVVKATPSIIFMLGKTGRWELRPPILTFGNLYYTENECFKEDKDTNADDLEESMIGNLEKNEMFSTLHHKRAESSTDEPRPPILNFGNLLYTENECFKEDKDTNADALAEGMIGNLERNEMFSTLHHKRAESSTDDQRAELFRRHINAIYMEPESFKDDTYTNVDVLGTESIRIKRNETLSNFHGTRAESSSNDQRAELFRRYINAIYMGSVYFTDDIYTNVDVLGTESIRIKRNETLPNFRGTRAESSSNVSTENLSLLQEGILTKENIDFMTNASIDTKHRSEMKKALDDVTWLCVIEGLHSNHSSGIGYIIVKKPERKTDTTKSKKIQKDYILTPSIAMQIKMKITCCW